MVETTDDINWLGPNGMSPIQIIGWSTQQRGALTLIIMTRSRGLVFVIYLLPIRDTDGVKKKPQILTHLNTGLQIYCLVETCKYFSFLHKTKACKCVLQKIKNTKQIMIDHHPD